MRKLAIGIIAVVFLGGCEYETQRERRVRVDEENPATVLDVERLDFPSYRGSAADALQFEIEYSDGTKVGCVYIWSGVSCVKLGSI
jgi:hypothetical protein